MVVLNYFVYLYIPAHCVLSMYTYTEITSVFHLYKREYTPAAKPAIMRTSRFTKTREGRRDYKTHE